MLRTSALAAVLVCLAAAAASAQPTCLDMSGPQTGLDDATIEAARERVRFELARQAVPLVDEGCEQTLYLSHTQIGTRVDVLAVLGSRTGEGTASSYEQLPAAWSAAIAALFPDAPARTPAVAARPWQRPDFVDVLTYIRFGAAGTLELDGRAISPAAGMGVRVTYQHLGIDMGFFDFAARDGGAVGNWLRLSALYYSHGLESGHTSAAYGGLGFGWTRVYGNYLGRDVSDTGISAIGTFGFHFLRNLPLGVFVQFDANLPTFLTVSDDYEWRSGEESPVGNPWTPTFTLSFGIGGAPRPR